MLELKGIHTHYGTAHVLFDVSLKVGYKQICCLLGRNGVGRTTCLRSIMGLTPPREGSIRFKDEEISKLTPYQIARRGIGYVPEDRRVFPDLTVRENLEVGELKRSGSNWWGIEQAYAVFPALRQLDKHLGGKLSGGEQQMLTVARTLMGCPSLLLLDEPTEGLSPIVVKELEKQILHLKEIGLTMLLAAQNMSFAIRVADHVDIMERGRIVYSNTIDHVRRDEATVNAYLVV